MSALDDLQRLRAEREAMLARLVADEQRLTAELEAVRAAILELRPPTAPLANQGRGRPRVNPANYPIAVALLMQGATHRAVAERAEITMAAVLKLSKQLKSDLLPVEIKQGALALLPPDFKASERVERRGGSRVIGGEPAERRFDEGLKRMRTAEWEESARAAEEKRQKWLAEGRGAA